MRRPAQAAAATHARGLRVRSARTGRMRGCGSSPAQPTTCQHRVALQERGALPSMHSTAVPWQAGLTLIESFSHPRLFLSSTAPLRVPGGSPRTPPTAFQPGGAGLLLWGQHQHGRQEPPSRVAWLHCRRGAKCALLAAQARPPAPDQPQGLAPPQCHQAAGAPNVPPAAQPTLLMCGSPFADPQM